MPPVTKLVRLARLATLPETRGLIVAATRSETVREVARRARSDRAGLVRDLGNPATARDLIRSAVTHPATRELASAGLVFLPGRYGPVGWAAIYAGRRVFRRVLDPLTEVIDRPTFGPRRPQKNVTPPVTPSDRDPAPRS
jgi:hypothetical protein